MGVLDRYLLRQSAGAALGALCALTALGVGLQLARLAEPGNHGDGLAAADLGRAALLALPPLAGTLMPLAALFAGLWSGAAAAGERAALAAAQLGLAPARLLAMPALVGCAAGLAGLLLLEVGEPWGLGGLHRLTLERAAAALARAAGGGGVWTLGEAVIVSPAGAARDGLGRPWVLGLRGPPADGAWTLLSAPRGAWLDSPGPAGEGDAGVDLEAGVLWRDVADQPIAWRLGFARARVRLDLGGGLGRHGSLVAEQGLPSAALVAVAGDPGQPAAARARAAVLRLRRHSVPAAAPLFMLLGVQLGGLARGRGLAAAAGALVVVVFYNIGRAAELACRAGDLGPGWAAWLANLALVAAFAAAAGLRAASGRLGRR